MRRAYILMTVFACSPLFPLWLHTWSDVFQSQTVANIFSRVPRQPVRDADLDKSRPNNGLFPNTTGRLVAATAAVQILQ